MNIKRIIFWTCFIIILGLILWGLVVAMKKDQSGDMPSLGTPAEVTSADNIVGAADASVTLIEYSDFQCPACAAYYPWVERLLTEASSTIRLVYRHFPLSQHANALPAAYAAEAAALQGKFWDMYRLLFENQSEWENSPNPSTIFEGYAGRIGLVMSIYKKDIDTDIVKSRVRKDLDEAIKIGVNSTPTFFVNGAVVSNPQSYESLKELIETAAVANTQ